MSSLHTKCIVHQHLTRATSCRLRSGGAVSRRSIVHVRAQSFKGNEGRSRGNMVDENMCILSRRIQEIRTVEMLERCCPVEQGWNYGATPHLEEKRAKKIVFHFLETIGYIGGVFSLPIMIGTLILFLSLPCGSFQ